VVPPETSGSSEETGGGAEEDETKPDIIDTRLIGLQILPKIFRSEYGGLGFGGRERGRSRGAVGAWACAAGGRRRGV
jgi:hypothetical protein